MARAFTHREFKLLMKPERFPTKSSVYDFNARLSKIATILGVDYEPFDAVQSQARQVQFFDTADNAFRRNRVILRLRRDRTGGWPDETWEVTLKRRSPDFDEAADFDVNTSMTGLTEKIKFKEEILRGDEPGTIHRIFSHNLCAQYPVVQFEHPISRIVEVFPGLKVFDFDPQAMVSSVHDANVFEIQANLGNFRFSKGVVSDCGLAVWVRPVPDSFDVLCAEFGFAYKVGGNDDKHQKGHDASDQFFKGIQTPLKDYLAEGSTKTAKIYGEEETTRVPVGR